MCLPLLASCASRPWQAFKDAGAGNSLPHRRDVSRKTNLHWDRRDSQLTESVRAPDADGPFFPVRITWPKKEDGGRGKRRSGNDSMWQGCDGAPRAKAVMAPCRHSSPRTQTPSVQMVRVDPDRPGVTALTSRCGEQHVNVMMWAAYHRLLFGNHGVASIAISIIAMTSVLNDFIQDTDKSNMLISFIQMGHLQSVSDWIKNIKYCKVAQDLLQKYLTIAIILQISGSKPFLLVTSLNEAVSKLWAV